MSGGTVVVPRSVGADGDNAEPLLGPVAVLVPVKAFAEAKGRLGEALPDGVRRQLVRNMAEHVLSMAAPLPVAVVCDDTEVADWARRQGALVIWEPGRGLNGAVEAGVKHLADMGVEQVTVVHGDLPLAPGLEALGQFDGVTLVPDHQGNGTNVLRLPSRCGFHFSYGPGSFQRHLAECGRLGVPFQVVHEPGLAFDVDWPADLHALR
jgi:2-phospho-L-lactate guanylyltransferase